MPRKGREGMGVKNFLVFCHYEQIKCICRTVQTILPYYTWSLCDLFMNFVALIFVFCPGFILNLFLISTGYSVQFSSVTQSCPTLCNPMNCSLPGSSVLGILQARILEWVAISFSRGSSQPRNWTQVYPHGRQMLYQLSYVGSPSRIRVKVKWRLP